MGKTGWNDHQKRISVDLELDSVYSVVSYKKNSHVPRLIRKIKLRTCVICTENLWIGVHYNCMSSMEWRFVLTYWQKLETDGIQTITTLEM
jgi:hypothetical protein